MCFGLVMAQAKLFDSGLYFVWQSNSGDGFPFFLRMVNRLGLA